MRSTSPIASRAAWSARSPPRATRWCAAPTRSASRRSTGSGCIRTGSTGAPTRATTASCWWCDRRPSRAPSLRLGRLRPDRRLALSGADPSSIFGAPLPRKEDARLVAGQGRYVTDVELPRMLHVAFVRSPHAHARIRGIDTDAALAAACEAAVAVGADPDLAPHRIEAPPALPGYVMAGQPNLAWPAARVAGEAGSPEGAPGPDPARDALPPVS